MLQYQMLRSLDAMLLESDSLGARGYDAAVARRSQMVRDLRASYSDYVADTVSEAADRVRDRGPQAAMSPTEARAAGRGGISAVSRATGIAYSTVRRGLNELADAGKFEAITKRINGGLNGQAERVALWEAAKRVLA